MTGKSLRYYIDARARAKRVGSARRGRVEKVGSGAEVELFTLACLTKKLKSSTSMFYNNGFSWKGREKERPRARNKSPQSRHYIINRLRVFFFFFLI